MFTSDTTRQRSNTMKQIQRGTIALAAVALCGLAAQLPAQALPDTTPPKLHTPLKAHFVVGIQLDQFQTGGEFFYNVPERIDWSGSDNSGDIYYSVWEYYAGDDPSQLIDFTQDTSAQVTTSDYEDQFGGGSFATENWSVQAHDFNSNSIERYVGGAHLLVTQDDGYQTIGKETTDVAIIGAPFDDAVSHRPGARFGPRAIREAQYTAGTIHSLQLDVDPFDVLTVVDAGDANIVPAWIERAHAMIYRKVRDVAGSGAIPIILGGDHSITWPSATAVAEARRPHSIGIVHFDAHADTANDSHGVLASHGTPMRRLIESGAVKGSNFVQVGLRGYWPPTETFEWMQAHGLRWHLMREIEERGAEAVIADAIAEALDGPDSIYLSVDIDVVDPGSAPGTGTPEPGGMLPRELLRAVRRIVGAVDLAGMDIVEVSPPYDHAETTANAAAMIAYELLCLKAWARGARGTPPGV
jgi:agmatinase